METIWFWFTRPKKPNFFQRLVQWRQGGPWSHVRMALPCPQGYEVLEAQAGRGLVQWFAQAPPDDVEVVPLPVHEVQLAKIRGWWAEHLGAKYDMVANIEIGFSRESSDQSAFNCSEAAAACCKAAGFFEFCRPGRVTPQELWAMVMARLEVFQWIAGGRPFSELF